MLFGKIDIYKENRLANVFVVLIEQYDSYSQALTLALTTVNGYNEMDRGTALKNAFNVSMGWMDTVRTTQTKGASFNFVGKLSKSLFGVAMTRDVRKLVKAINNIGGEMYIITGHNKLIGDINGIKANFV